jgi:hypothetical protein
MTVGFNPSVSNSKSRVQKQNFGKVNEYWLNRLVNNTSEFNNGFHSLIINRKISKTDAVDTLTAFKDKMGEGYKKAIENKIESVKKYLTD